MASNWNMLMDRQKVAGLTKRESQVVATIARKTLGWVGREQGDRISVRQIATETGLDRRNVNAALRALISRRVILSSDGREGAAATLSVNVDPTQPWFVEPALVATPPNRRQKRRQSTESASEQPASVATPQPASVATPSIGKGVKQEKPAAPAVKKQTFLELVYEAYLTHGGSFRLYGHRSILGAKAKQLAAAGVEERWIVAAACELGRNQGWVGDLKHVAYEIVAAGGICKHDGSDRMLLTTQQLEECDCIHCQQWVKGRKEAELMGLAPSEWAKWKLKEATAA